MTHDVNRPGQTAQSRGISRDSMEIVHSQYSQDVNNGVESQRRNSVTVSNEHATATASPRMETPHSVSEADLSPSQPSPSLLPQGSVNSFACGIGSCRQNTQDKAANASHSRTSSRQSAAAERRERSTSTNNRKTPVRSANQCRGRTRVRAGNAAGNVNDRERDRGGTKLNSTLSASKGEQ